MQPRGMEARIRLSAGRQTCENDLPCLGGSVMHGKGMWQRGSSHRILPGFPYGGVWWAGLDGRSQARDRLGGALCFHLHTAVSVIAHVARQPLPCGGAADELPEPHALYAPVYSPVYAHVFHVKQFTDEAAA
jgi:hypothetical protein